MKTVARRALVCGLMSWMSLMLAGRAAAAEKPDDPLAPWREGVRVHPVSAQPGRHTIHSYYVTSPESPDGSKVLFYASTTPEGHTGELRILERATGQERVIAKGVTVEDAHRAACQQWVSGGRRVVYHDCRNGEWVVAAIDLASGRETILARDHQVGWVQPGADLVPVYGCHWAPGKYRDVEMVDLATSSVRTALTADAVRQAYPEQVKKLFGDKPISIYFPVYSPDSRRVFFKLATAGNGDFRSSGASTREGLTCYDLTTSKFLFMREKWGHPAWHPDSRRIIEIGNQLIDSDDKGGKVTKIPNGPTLSGAHQSVSPDGRLFVADGMLPGDKQKNLWSVVVGRIDGGGYVVLHQFDNAHGASSWRKSHPHPHFSADSRRIYYNVNSGPWTELYVAESP